MPRWWRSPRQPAMLSLTRLRVCDSRCRASGKVRQTWQRFAEHLDWLRPAGSNAHRLLEELKPHCYIARELLVEVVCSDQSDVSGESGSGVGVELVTTIELPNGSIYESRAGSRRYRTDVEAHTFVANAQATFLKLVLCRQGN